jgi:hypothetical protein
MATLSNKMGAKMSQNEETVYECIICDYKCCKKFNYRRHILSAKHIKATINSNLATKNEQNEQNEQKTPYCCNNCGKDYQDRTGLWRHKKICGLPQNNYDDKITSNVTQITPELVLSVLKQNSELTTLVAEQNKTIMELAKNGTVQNINMQNVNNNNKTFNLNVFLNETCKDAMNITDFVDSIQLQLSDLENVGKLGFVEGISSIIVKKLQALDVHKRPVHCADKKREVIYIKDDDKWERDSDEKNKLRKVIKTVAFKNQNLLPKFRLEHPGCNFSESKYADHYSKLVIESMRDDDVEKQDKIIRNIVKEVVIDKKEYM